MPRNPKHSLPRLTGTEPPYDTETADILAKLGPPILLFRILARRPSRARGVLGWGQYYLSHQSALSLRHRELVIDRTTARCGAEYEWGIHITYFAEKVGLDENQILSTAHGDADDPCWTEPSDRAVLAAVDALHDTNDLTDAQWSALITTIGEEATIDLLLLCGWYHAIAFVARAGRLPGEELARKWQLRTRTC